MKLRELIKYSKALLKRKRISTAIVCLLPFLPEIFFRSVEATVYSLLIYVGEMNPLSLFSGENPIQLTVAIFIMILRWLTTAPLVYVSAFRLCEICYDNNSHNFTPLSEIFVNGRNFGRSLTLSLWTKFIGILSLIPAGICGLTAYYLIMNTDNLFMAVQAVVFTIVSLYFWLNVRLTLFVVPFLMAHFPQKSVFRLVWYSFRFIRGRRTSMIKLFMTYSLPIITLVTAPYFLPELMTAFSLSISIYIREDDYSERIKINRKFNKSADSAKVPYHRKRRFTAFAHKTKA
ncbi:MAG: hypothetical protein NC205_08990 [Prevotella sp.]|nr:hypothetical protein [Alistipes senegalensis]MCM1358719.1 hypothetical protein [Prevotella sp.]MCM1473061.1 hypothetical protein [Muribaculaceae bacterium]